MRPQRLDRDAVLDALQDQIDHLAAAVATHVRLLEAHAALIIELARLAGLGHTTDQLRRPELWSGDD